VPGRPAAVLHGASLHLELELLVQCGMTPTDVLAAATSRAADVFALADRGRIAVGRRADLLLVDGDPTVDVTDTRALRAVWRAGVQHDLAHPVPVAGS
jgi:imidazolonepropionase-like amidohydrolase